LGLFAEVSAAQHEVRKRRADAERRVHECATPADLHAALAAAMMLGDPDSGATSPLYKAYRAKALRILLLLVTVCCTVVSMDGVGYGAFNSS
jgi:hypothetical protein